jgi:hypothetical protein
MNRTANPHEFNLHNESTGEKITSRTLANNLDTDADTLESLVHHDDFYVRRGVAANYNTSTFSLSKLGSDVEEQVRFYLAANPKTPVQILEKLADDESDDVRSQVAGNPTTPVGILEQLSTDSYLETLRLLAENPKTTSATLAQIANNLFELAKERLLFSHESSTVRAIASNQNTPIKILEQICSIDDGQNQYWLLALSVAQNPRTPEYLLEKLAQHQDVEVRRSIASHPKTPAAILEQLATDKEKIVTQAVQQRFAMSGQRR